MIKVSTKSVKIEADLTKEQETTLLAMIAKLAIGNMEAGEEREAPAQPQAPDAPPSDAKVRTGCLAWVHPC